MRKFRGMLMCAIAGVGVLLGATSAWATPTSGELFYTTFAGGTNVHKVDYSYDGAATFTLSNNTGIDAVTGADGIVGNPQDSSTLIVGGQSSGLVHVVKKDGSGSVSFASPVLDNYHLEVPDTTTLLTASIPGAVGRFTINPGGSLTANGTIPLVGTDTVLTQVITTPGGDFYTSSFSGGVGSYGTLTYDTGLASTATSATTAAIHVGLPAAHGGVYDPFSNSVILFGSDHITQLDLAGTIIADLTFAGTGQNFDQGSVDGMGHIFAASNNGDLTFIDYSTAAGMLIDGAGNFISTQFLATALDDVAPLIGAGGTGPGPGGVPEPVTAALGLMGLGVLSMATRRRVA